jgi:succinate dehydrogenase / fumarate reductase cytochrome b subunit
MEVVLFAGFFIHIIQGLAVEFQNRSKRKIGYEVDLGNRGSKWYSRSMGLLGTILLLFLLPSLVAFLDPIKIYTYWHRRANTIIKWIYRA